MGEEGKMERAGKMENTYKHYQPKTSDMSCVQVREVVQKKLVKTK